MVLTAAVHVAAVLAVLAAVVLIVAVLTVVVPTEADTVAVMVADADKSEHQLPDFRIRHPRNLAH